MIISLIAFAYMPKSWAQKPDTVQKGALAPVHIEKRDTRIKASAAAIQTITAKQLHALPSLQLSDALKYMSGVVIRDYGGTGGIKTISVRGLSTQHTGVIYDDIALTDCQTGQIDLGKLSLDNIATIDLITGTDMVEASPAQRYSYSNILDIKTFQQVPNKPLHLKISLLTGSYGLVSPQIFAENLIRSKKRTNRYFLWNISANYLLSKGDYPYILHYGGQNDSISHERRQNSDISAFNAELNARMQFDSLQSLSFKWYYYDSERGLPSATIFYNLESAQRLWNRNTFAQLQYRYGGTPVKKNCYKLSAKFNYDFTHYLDPEYLNAQGKIDNTYRQFEGYLSNAYLFKPLLLTHKRNPEHKDKFLFSVANDLIYNQLESNATDFLHPSRLTTLTSFSGKYEHHDILTVNANLLLTTVNNFSQTAYSSLKDAYVHVSPMCGLSVNATSKIKLRAFYKNIFRMPTFNDLYYREVGNLNLKPEKTHQTDVGIVFDQLNLTLSRNVWLSAALDGYFNIVKDKIVAFPSRNLFSWTMLNYGIVYIGGAELNAQLSYQFVKKHSLNITGNCTYQKAVDRTDPQNKTYNHQIPYTPMWSGSASIGLQTPYLTLTYSLIACGNRYALGQNIPANLVNGYLDHSITLSSEVDIKETTLGLKLELLNITNNQYEIIKNYPMQGFGFRIKLYFAY